MSGCLALPCYAMIDPEQCLTLILSARDLISFPILTSTSSSDVCLYKNVLKCS